MTCKYCEDPATRRIEIRRNDRHISTSDPMCPQHAIAIARDVDRYASLRRWDDRAYIMDNTP